MSKNFKLLIITVDIELKEKANIDLIIQLELESFKSRFQKKVLNKMLLSEHEDKHNVAKLHNFQEELPEAGLSQLCNSNFHCD